MKLNALGLALGLVFGTAGPAHAGDADYCALYAREATRIGFATTTDPDLNTADQKLILFTQSRELSHCLLVDGNPPLPDGILSSDSAWAEAVHLALADKNKGSQPATAAPATVTAEASGDLPKPAQVDPNLPYPPKPTGEYAPADLKECRRQYRSFDPKTNTVIQYGHHGKRTLCPLL